MCPPKQRDMISRLSDSNLFFSLDKNMFLYLPYARRWLQCTRDYSYTLK